MYTLTHEGENVGNSKLERGDPSIRAVSGVFNNMGGSKSLANWIKSIGGEEDEGVVFIDLNKDFSLLDEAGNVVEFSGGNLISIPDADEIYLDVTGITDEVYKTYFSEHISAMGN
ncbi:MAG: hypothetical protein DIZ80_00255 [endosymbiont of Galathealinum brachiosum]|uniref:Uncharacterized protein n=1 Tax=endosymbiont of Galathealinum brachiosum TaxID=2200906 RepID=A0A370DM70_9GAMM|nr:MAG: hypothetical protein DIZ80_00255 [endosymbiont of Galathealinum brachiosum]